MANLIDVAQELEYVPEDQLASMIDDPNSKYPSFMVLSEVQRRTQMRKIFENELSKMQTPQTTVAEEAVMEMTGIGAMPMQAGMSSPVNSQGSGLQGMAPPMITAQTGLYTSQEQLIARLKRLAEQGDINAQRELQQLTERLGDISNFVYDDTTKDLSATMPQSFTIENLPAIQRGISQGLLGEQRAKRFSDSKEKTRESILKGGFSPSSPPFEDIPQDTLLGRVGAAVTPFVDEAKSGLKSYITKIPSTLQMPGGRGFDLGPFEGLFDSEKAQASELTSGLNNLTNPQFSILNKSDDVADDTSQVGLASANNPNLTDSKIMSQFQEQLEEIFGVPTQEFESTFGEPISLRSREEIRDDVAKRLNLPEVTSMKQSEADRQKDMNVALLTGLGAVIGGAKQTGDIATGIGKLGRDISQMRKDARKEDMLSDRLTRQENLQNINLITGIVNAEQTAERATKQLQMAEKKDFDASQLAQKGLQISQAKLVETGLRLQLAERAQAQGVAQFELDQIKALQAQVSNLTSTLATDPTLITDPTRAAQIQGQIDAINQEVNRRFSVPEVEKQIQEVLKQAQKQ